MTDKPLGPTRREMAIMAAVSVAGATMLPRRLFAQAGGGGLITDADVCLLTPELAAGPFYFDPALVRTNLTEGKDGLPLRVRLQVVDADCNPYEGARVDIWHCDVAGVYSGYEGQPGNIATVGQTFLRGTQFTGPEGIAEFETIYPGWYPGRTTHIHFKVFLDDTSVLTGQFFFSEDLNEEVYASVPAYARLERREVFNANDRAARQVGESALASVASGEETIVASLILGIDPRTGSAG